jgi:hypothetical protein
LLQKLSIPISSAVCNLLSASNGKAWQVAHFPLVGKLIFLFRQLPDQNYLQVVWEHPEECWYALSAGNLEVIKSGLFITS